MRASDGYRLLEDNFKDHTKTYVSQQKAISKKASANAEGLNRRDRKNLREMVDHVEINDGNNTSDNTHT